MKDETRQLEAILFASDKPLTIEDMAARMEDGADIHALIREITAHYEGRGFELVQTGKHYAFRTAPDLAESLELHKEDTKPLSRAAMETLAIIAYHQPVTRAEIENIRGVAVGKGTLDILMEAGWVKPGRRRQVPGKPLTWVTADEFLDHFGLSTIMELPGLEEMKASGLLDTRPAIETLPGTEDLFGDNDDTDDKKESTS